MNDKYVKLADVKRKLRYIFKAYGVGGFVREKVERTLNDLPYSAKGDLETTLEAADVQPVKRGKWKQIAPQSAICSQCGGALKSNGIDKTGKAYIFKAVYKYCPCCGARMDGDTECQ